MGGREEGGGILRKRKPLLGPPTLLPLRVEVGRRGGREKRGRKWEEALGWQLAISFFQLCERRGSAAAE